MGKPGNWKRPAERPLGKALAFLPAAAWYAVIFRFSAQVGWVSGDMSDKVVEKSIDLMGELGDRFRSFDGMQLLSMVVRKGAHMGVFFVLMGLLLFGLWKAGLVSPLPRACSAVGLCVLLAALDEVHQYFVPGRDCRGKDVLIDLAGGLICLLLWLLLRALRRPRVLGAR